MSVPPATMTTEAIQALQTAFDRTQIWPSASLLWDRILTPAEREQLGGDPEAAFNKFGTVGMWVQLRKVTAHRALLDVAQRLGHLSEMDYTWLMREIGLEADNSPPENRPHFNQVDGKLHFGTMLIRKVRINKEPSNVHKILNAFQAADWAPRVPNPLKLGQEQLHQSLRSLNNTLKAIRFHSLEGGKAIRWEKN